MKVTHIKNIRSFTLGFVLAAAIFICYSAKAGNDPSIVGDNGYLSGVDVFTEKGERICTGPFWDKKAKTLECKY